MTKNNPTSDIQTTNKIQQQHSQPQIKICIQNIKIIYCPIQFPLFFSFSIIEV